MSSTGGPINTNRPINPAEFGVTETQGDGAAVSSNYLADKMAKWSKLPPEQLEKAVMKDLFGMDAVEVGATTGVQQSQKAAAAKMSPQVNLPPPSLVGVKTEMTPERQIGAEMFVRDVQRCMDFGMSSIEMFKEFLELNVENPSDDPKTHAALYEACSNLRQAQIEEAQAKLDEAIEAQKEAQDSAKYAKTVGIVAIVITVIASAILTAVTFGAFASVAPFLIAGCVAAILAAGTAGATANLSAEMDAIEAQELEVDASAAQLKADEAQSRLEEEGEVIQLLMELRNEFCSNIMKMLQAMGVTQMTALKKTAPRA